MSTILSHSKKFIFIHNYKVAGSSISDVLARYEPYYWTRTIIRKIGVKKYYPTLANFAQHANHSLADAFPHALAVTALSLGASEGSVVTHSAASPNGF